MKKENKKEIEKELLIVFFGGTTAKLIYKIDEMADDPIWEDFRKGWEANNLWYPQDWADFEMKIGEQTVQEIDMRKVIGASYY